MMFKVLILLVISLCRAQISLPPPLSTGAPGPPPSLPGGIPSRPPPGGSGSAPPTTAPSAATPPRAGLPGVPTVPDRNYVCVPVGTCASSNNDNVIDPRIVSPTQPLCPAGQEACYNGQTGGPQCGIRYVGSVSQENGIASAGAYPWQAYVLNQTGYTGSGVLLDRFHVLTAAHKVDQNQGTPGNIRVIMGVYNPANMTGTQNFIARDVTIHPNYNSRTLWNDIAVVRLSSPVRLGFQSTIGVACTPNQNQSFVNQRCMVSGWGQSAWEANDAPTTPQKQASVPIVSYQTCRASMLNLLGTNTDVYLDPAGEICAGGETQLDACTQDGGAPMVCIDSGGKFSVAGLVIWGKKCGMQGVYGVYVNVPFYKTWIDNTIRSFNQKYGS